MEHTQIDYKYADSILLERWQFFFIKLDLTTNLHIQRLLSQLIIQKSYLCLKRLLPAVNYTKKLPATNCGGIMQLWMEVITESTLFAVTALEEFTDPLSFRRRPQISSTTAIRLPAPWWSASPES